MGASTGVSLIAAERHRVITAEGYTPEHDDGHAYGELVDAAIQYADAANGGDLRADGALPEVPWGDEWFKPSDDPIRNLVKAGALIAAEIDRLLRAKAA